MRTYKALRTQSKIFFPDPYVVRVQYDGSLLDTQTDAAYRNLLRRTYKSIQGTWGHSALLFETLPTSKENQPPLIPPASAQTTLTPSLINTIYASIFSSDMYSVKRGYFCFKDELDALQFRLSIDVTAVQVIMWPKETLFTIHEVVEVDE
jgi:hypothetical protein